MVHQNSLLAYADFTPEVLGNYESMILRWIRKNPGHTANEVRVLMKVDKDTVRARIHELHKKGLLEEMGRRKDNLTGKLASTWRINNND